MRAKGRDIVELFGYRPNDISFPVVDKFKQEICPFLGTTCSKTNHDQTVIYGVCSVSNGVKTGVHDEVVVCPKRLYQKNYQIFQDLVGEVWGVDVPLIIGGSLSQLREKALMHSRSAIAFGQTSGTEIGVNSNGQMSMDWVIQFYERETQKLVPRTFLGIEVQSIDITGNYRDNWTSYAKMKRTGVLPNHSSAVADSGHGLNWANVHKRLIPQIIRKGNVYRGSSRCDGFYFIAPEMVYQKFEEVIGQLPPLDGPAKDRLSIKTYSLGPSVPDGQIRDIVPVRTIHMDSIAVAQAFITNVDSDAPKRLDDRLLSIL